MFFIADNLTKFSRSAFEKVLQVDSGLDPGLVVIEPYYQLQDEDEYLSERTLLENIISN